MYTIQPWFKIIPPYCVQYHIHYTAFVIQSSHPTVYSTIYSVHIIKRLFNKNALLHYWSVGLNNVNFEYIIIQIKNLIF